MHVGSTRSALKLTASCRSKPARCATVNSAFQDMKRLRSTLAASTLCRWRSFYSLTYHGRFVVADVQCSEFPGSPFLQHNCGGDFVPDMSALAFPKPLEISSPFWKAKKREIVDK